MEWKEFLAQHNGDPTQIPSDALYGYLKSPEVLGTLINLAKLGSAAIAESAVGKEVRRRSKQDLMWLARYFTWETNPASAGLTIDQNRITEEEYRPVIDLFVKKDDSKSIVEQDPSFKSRMLLWSRGGCKSTIDIVDASQWILNFPDIRILFLTATKELAEGFIKELKGHFVIKPDEPSLMNLFFPEFCIEDSNKGNKTTFQCPVWERKNLDRKEPTVFAAAVGSTKSGWHFELIKADDAVSDKNSETPEQCQTVSKKLALVERLLVPGGFYIDFIGTRYDDLDHYGLLLEKNVGDIETDRSHPCRTLIINKTTGLKMLIGRGVVIKPEVAEQLEKDGKPINYKEAGAEGCDLLLPSFMTYPWLMSEYSKNELVFEGQINQNPTPSSTITYDKHLMQRCTIPPAEMPFRGLVSQTWDFAFSKKKGRDYTTGSSVLWGPSSVGYVHDLVRQKFPNPTMLAKAVVDLARKHHPFIIGIEDAAGSKLLEPTIIYEAQKTGDQAVIDACSRIDWIPVENQKDSKKTRMATLHPLLMDDRLKFANYLPHLEVLYSEFEKCLTSHHHDDIPDVLSRQPKYAPRMQMPTDGKPLATQMPNSIDQAAWNIYFDDGDCFGRPGMATPPPIVEVASEPDVKAESSYDGLPPILGAGFCG